MLLFPACAPESIQAMEYYLYKKWDEPWARHLLNPHLLAAMLSWLILLTIGISITVIVGLCCPDNKPDPTVQMLSLPVTSGHLAPAYEDMVPSGSALGDLGYDTMGKKSPTSQM